MSERLCCDTIRTITHYPLPITHYRLPITHYPLPIIYTFVPLGGWGCPDLIIRSQLILLQGCVVAYDCRSVHAQELLRAQAAEPLTLGQDDASVFRYLCH